MRAVLANKAKIGAVLLAVVQVLRLFPEIPSEVIELLSVVAGMLTGSGLGASDAAVRKFGDSAK
jgi:hypothetical protein